MGGDFNPEIVESQSESRTKNVWGRESWASQQCIINATSRHVIPLNSYDSIVPSVREIEESLSGRHNIVGSKHHTATRMQSLLQHRRLGGAAQAQLDQDAQKIGDYSFQRRYANGLATPEAGGVVRQATRSQTTAPAQSGEGVNLEMEQQGPADDSASGRDLEDQEGAALGPALTGVDVRHASGPNNGPFFIVGWTGPNDPLMPRNWPLRRRVGVTLQIALTAMILTAASAIDSAVLPQAAKDLHVSEVAESLATGRQFPRL